jgi:homoserine O-succinyltransferase
MKSTAMSEPKSLGGFAITQPLTIAFVNNMPDAALKSAEAQFRTLLKEAAGHHPIQFRNFYLPGVPRHEQARAHLAEFYSPITRLTGSAVDALIVTGAMPSASSFEEEPYWPGFVQLADWAAERSIPTYWSCLAAHAAVNHLDGIGRRRLGMKLSGVFPCERASSHPLLDGAALSWQAPHSRYNDLSEADLTAAGYRVVSRLATGSPDMFVNAEGNFVFSQGHLEYDRTTLLGEYQRDWLRFSRGELTAPPDMPANYFDQNTIDKIADVTRAAGTIAEHALAEMKRVLSRAGIVASWRPTAVQIFANWVRMLTEKKVQGGAAIAAFGSARANQALPEEMEWRVE